MINHNINKHSNQPPNIRKELPEVIQKRLSELSSSQDWFKSEYNESVKAAGYSQINLINQTISNPIVNYRFRKRKIIWFNQHHTMRE